MIGIHPQVQDRALAQLPLPGGRAGGRAPRRGRPAPSAPASARLGRAARRAPAPSPAVASMTRERAPRPRGGRHPSVSPGRRAVPAVHSAHGRPARTHAGARAPSPRVPGRGSAGAQASAEAPAADAGRAPLLARAARAARGQLRHRRTGLEQPVARVGALQLLPRAGRGRQRRRGHLDRRHDPGRLQQGGAARRTRAGRPSTRLHRPSGRPSATTPGSTRCWREHDVVINAKPDRTPTPLLAADPARLRADAAARRPVRARLRAGVAARRAPAVRSAAFGRSRAKRYEPDEAQRVTFADVAGIDEAEEELAEVVDFLRRPGASTRGSGARVPKGVLLVRARPGPARRCSPAPSPARRTCRSSRSRRPEFIEVIVGVGASRVRDLFGQAKAAAPAIIFIDELDAIGRVARSGRIVRRPRRARADAQPDPDRDGRLHRHRGRDRDRGDQPARGARLGAAAAGPVRPPRHRSARPTSSAASRSSRCTRAACRSADDVDLGALAASTPGMVGADLRNLVNEAALIAARRGTDQVQTGRLHRRARADRARRRAPDHALGRGARAHRLPRVGPRAARHADRPAPTRCARSRSSRAGARSASPSRAPRPIATATATTTCAAGSSARSAAGPPRRSCTAT